MSQTAIDSVLRLVPEQKVLPGTRLKLKGLMVDLVAVNSQENGWRIRSELQGMLNCLELQGIISEAELVAINDAVRLIWTPLARQFVLGRVCSDN